MDFFRQYSVGIGILSMITIILGTFAQAGSMMQKMLFFFPAPVLVYVAYVGGQRMLMTLQFMVTLGAALAFMDYVPSFVRYYLLIGCSLVGVVYLIKIGYFKEDVWWPVGGLGMILLSFGYSTDAMNYPILFNSLLTIGGMLVAVYSSISYFRNRVRIAFIWLFLNIVFVVKPLSVVISMMA